MFASTDQQGSVMGLFLLIAFVAYVVYRRQWRPAGTAFGTARWADLRVLRSCGMLKGKGLVLGRTERGALIRLPRYCHVLLVGTPGSGKGVSIIIPNLLTYDRGSIICFDTKGDLFATAERRQRKGQKVIRIAPFNGGSDGLNPLDLVPRDSPVLVDTAAAMAEALVVRLGTEPDQHWADKAVQVIKAILVLILLRFRDQGRNLNSLQDIASDNELLLDAAHKLRDIGGIPARLGSQLLALFEKDSSNLTKEGAGVLSTVARHLAFLDSELVAKAVAKSSFSVSDLLRTGTTLYLQVPPDHLEAQKGFVRCIISALIREIGKTGDETKGEVLCLIDEASALGSLAAVEEALVRGRSAGTRLLLAYQSDAQVRAAFKDKPTLLYDACSTQVYLGASSYETAERISKSLGEYTQVVDSYGENLSRSWQEMGANGRQTSQGNSNNYAQSGRALLRPEEVLSLSDDYLIAFLRSMPPVLACRIKWYEDRDFNPNAPRKRFGFRFKLTRQRVSWALVALAAAIVWWVNWR